jgi:hypothetical protein
MARVPTTRTCRQETRKPSGTHISAGSTSPISASFASTPIAAPYQVPFMRSIGTPEGLFIAMDGIAAA